MHKPDIDDLSICEQRPEWSTGHAHGEYVLGAQLPTRDGRRCGNAHIIAAEPARWDSAKTVYTCLTDAGQQILHTKGELEEMFYPPQWLSDIAEVKRKFGGSTSKPKSARPERATSTGMKFNGFHLMVNDMLPPMTMMVGDDVYKMLTDHVPWRMPNE